MFRSQKGFRPRDDQGTDRLLPVDPAARLTRRVHRPIWGRDREAALKRMERALNECAVTGITTTIDFHLKLLKRKEFTKGDVHTKFVEQEML